MYNQVKFLLNLLVLNRSCCCFFPFLSVQECAFEKFTAQFWFGGKFKWTNNALDYVGGEGCTIEIDANLISWFDSDDLVVNKVGVEYEHSLFIMNPACIQFDCNGSFYVM